MAISSDISMQEAYKEFCSRYPLKKLCMPKSDSVWSYFDINVKHENVIIFLHGICGTAGCFFYQMEFLSKLRFRIISLQYPCYNYISEWIKNLCNILEYLNIKKAHFFACDLSGYLIQLYAKLYPLKISSLILCNAYRRTEDFAKIASLRNIYGKIYSFLPHLILKNIMLEDYIYSNNYYNIDLKEKNALEFMSNELDIISAPDLGGRISLQLSSETVDSISVSDKCITLIQTVNNKLSETLNEDMRQAYPKAKHALMKSGGYFPYLSRYEEVNLYISVHLRNNCSTQFAKEQIDKMAQMNTNRKKKNSYEAITVTSNNIDYDRNNIEGNNIENVSSQSRDAIQSENIGLYHDEKNTFNSNKQYIGRSHIKSGHMSKDYNKYAYHSKYTNDYNADRNTNAYMTESFNRSDQFYENISSSNYDNNECNNKIYAHRKYIADPFSEQNEQSENIYDTQESYKYNFSENHSTEKINKTFRGLIQEEDYDNEDSEDEYINEIRENSNINAVRRFNQNNN